MFSRSRSAIDRWVFVLSAGDWCFLIAGCDASRVKNYVSRNGNAIRERNNWIIITQSEEKSHSDFHPLEREARRLQIAFRGLSDSNDNRQHKAGCPQMGSGREGSDPASLCNCQFSFHSSVKALHGMEKWQKGFSTVPISSHWRPFQSSFFVFSFRASWDAGKRLEYRSSADER